MSEGQNLQLYSRTAIRQSVRTSSVNHPITLYPMALGVLGLVAGGLFGLPAIMAAGAGGLALGAGNFITSYYLRYDTLARRHMKELHDAMVARLKNRPTELAAECRRHDFSRGQEQLSLAEAKYGEFIDALGRKFDTGELTYGRYAGVAQTVYFAILENLELATAKLASVQSIDPESLSQRITDLKKKGVDADEIQSLEVRLGLRTSAFVDVDKLLAHNERALTLLDETALKVAGIQTKKVGAVRDADLAMKELELLAARAADYEGK
ncbi:hypothetical protein [Kordiimonas marina]|uniref:hypothetical protein n=1 Tax=Kordiimonas marina TaxID=2872312 RepID=UPI001FF3F3CD|nr:hypothetical protein [Kordiimonas marina]MCJ9430069.1 hypothetical protein [Kordiimonas marina]